MLSFKKGNEVKQQRVMFYMKQLHKSADIFKVHFKVILILLHPLEIGKIAVLFIPLFQEEMKLFLFIFKGAMGPQ